MALLQTVLGLGVDFAGKIARRIKLDTTTPVAEAEHGWDSTDKCLNYHNGTLVRSLFDTKINEFTAADTNFTLASAGITTTADFTPTVNAHLGNKGYIDGAIATAIANAGSVKELCIAPEQFTADANALVSAQAMYVYIGVSTGNMILKDASTTETYPWKNAGPYNAFDIDASTSNADTIMDNIVTVINTDSVVWSAIKKTNLQSINSGAGDATAGHVIIIYRKDQTAASVDRFYGSIAGGIKVVNFNGETDYSLSTNTDLPTTDPAVKTFGLGKINSELTPNETHFIRSADTTQYSWDDDSQTWQVQISSSMSSGEGWESSGGVGNIKYSLLTNTFAASEIVAADLFSVYDSSITTQKKITYANFLTTIAGNGIENNFDGDLKMSINNLSGVYAAIAVGDLFAFADVSDSAATKKMTWANIQTNLAGNGLTTSGVNLIVENDVTTGTNVAGVVSVTANGTGIGIDNSTIKENGSNQLYVDPANLTISGLQIKEIFTITGNDSDTDFVKNFSGITDAAAFLQLIDVTNKQVQSLHDIRNTSTTSATAFFDTAPATGTNYTLKVMGDET